jgi:transketolase
MLTIKELANAIRFLSMDAVQQANSGHPGMPMGMADIAAVLWLKFLNHNPANPAWFNRDRFVLSNGHGSMLLYSLLHLSGYDLPIEQLKNFRQLHSITPGHPEFGETPGVETTTGPLGQGLANAIGMAIAEKVLSARFNQDGSPIIDHYTYAFCGDGCLMEGISHEASSLAGTLGLGKLIVFYDDNGISIDGKVKGWFCDDTPKRFEAYGWHVISDIDGHDPIAIENAITSARQEQDKPSILCCKTIIGFSSPKFAGSEKSHGAPLGNDEINIIRKQSNWPFAPFDIPDDYYRLWNSCEKGQAAESQWNQLVLRYKATHPELYQELNRRMKNTLPEQWHQHANDYITQCLEQNLTVASRKASQNSLNAYGPLLPELIGGSADLAGSNNTIWSGSKTITTEDSNGNYLYYGVREFAMAAIMNGLALHRGFIPYGGTFLVFSDYARNAIRLSAMMKQRIIYVLTHDSIGLGEDGPTHQPIEHAAILRLTPNINVWRPADNVETAIAWKHAIENTTGPSCLLLSRQNLPALHQTQSMVDNISRGAYIIYDNPEPDTLLLATGSEVALAIEAAKELKTQGIAVRVVSMACCEIFDKQSADYKESILPKSVTKRVAIEAAVSDYWYKYIGHNGAIIGLTRFGVSAPASDAFNYFGITASAIIQQVKQLNV